MRQDNREVVNGAAPPWMVEHKTRPRPRVYVRVPEVEPEVKVHYGGQLDPEEVVIPPAPPKTGWNEKGYKCYSKEDRATPEYKAYKTALSKRWLRERARLTGSAAVPQYVEERYRITEKRHIEKTLCSNMTHDGEICENVAFKNGKCEKHGGSALAGIAAPGFKTGRYSKVLPGNLREVYERSLNDDERLVLTEEVALVDARLSQLLEQAGEGGQSAAAWVLAEAAWNRLETSIHAGDRNGILRGVDKLRECFASRSTSNDRGAWTEISKLISQRRELVESERKRIVEAGDSIDAQSVMALVAFLLDSVSRNVSNAHERAAIQKDYSRFCVAQTGVIGRIPSAIGREQQAFTIDAE